MDDSLPSIHPNPTNYHFFQIWLQKGTVFLLALLLAVNTHGFRFESEETKTLVGTAENVEKVESDSINPVEYEDELVTEEKEREERKIDPLVVDVERKPLNDVINPEAKEAEVEQPEGRFFLKDKLCALGLADVRFVVNLHIHTRVSKMAKVPA